jgi:hypothetical protein
MKLKSDMRQVASDKKNNVSRAAHSCHPSRVTRHPPGVALIITLILLAVVTFMALTFLAISRRERNAVTTTTDSLTAQLAADDALASAEAQVVANLLATSNSFNFGLLVSTNYINPNGFVKNLANPTNVNYDYYSTGPGPLALDDFLQNLANLFYLPRVPVFVPTNATGPLDFRFYLDLNRNNQDDPNGFVPEFGPLGLYIHPDGTEDNNNANVVSNNQVGDPEWIGVLQHPDQPYGPNNPFVARYAFIAAPIGNALDLNAIHNQVFDGNPALASGKGALVNPSPFGPGLDSFFRNQGVGSWEINLAAFLADLNTNQWLSNTPPNVTYYSYTPFNPPPGGGNQGRAFDDARALLAYRYQNNYASLKPVGRLLARGPIIANDNIDEYSDGPLQIRPAPIIEIGASEDRTNFSWAGADNTNHYFDVQELFDTTKAALGVAAGRLLLRDDFPDRLRTAGNGVSTYDRYTFYRLISQMGVASAPEQTKLNLNYSNACAYFDANGVVTNIAYFPNAETNLVPWTNALQFFTIAGDRMLRTYSQQWLVESPSNYVATFSMTTNTGSMIMPVSFGLGNIPVWVSNRFVYTPAVQRVLQLAANMYDATTNNAAALGANFPSVFRPIFNVVREPPPPAAPVFTNVYIAGYEPVLLRISPPPLDLPFDPQLAWPVSIADLVDGSPHTPNLSGFGPGPAGTANVIYTNLNVYGVPWIIGAKKGFPNFNKFNLQSAFQLTRKLQVTRQSTNDTFTDNPGNYHFNQMFNLSLSNQFGVECWNSYTNGYHPNNHAMVIYVRGNLRHAALSNEENFSVDLPVFPIFGSIVIPAGNVWPGYNPVTDPLGSLLSFQIPLNTNVTVIPTAMYRFNDPSYPLHLTTNLDLPFEVGVTFNGNPYPQPHWFLTTTNELQVFMLDTSVVPNRVIDYVQLSGPNSTRDLTGEIITNYDAPVISIQPGGSQLWNTNYLSGVPIGLLSQVGISLGNYTASAASGAWDQSSPSLLANEIAGFNAFFGYTPPPPYVPGEVQAIATAQMTNAMQTPYTPTATVVQHVSWQANDPLIHYLASDLNWGLNGASAIITDRYVDSLTNNSPNGNLGALNQGYRPWGGNPLLPGADQDPYNQALKDPLVRQSDDWDFPAYKFPSVGWLGRVHRGTPWQTIYLKSRDVVAENQTNAGTVLNGTNVWTHWTGNVQLANGQNYDAVNTAPAQDRLLFDIFTTAINDNATRGQLSVNVGAGDPSPQAGLAAWSALFSGVIALSNNAVDGAIATNVILQHNGSMASFTTFLINPAGPGGMSSALGQIVTNINLTRATLTNADGLAGSFEHVGDILAVPELTAKSPFLNWFDNGSPLQQINGISDELYERLPEQVMSLLHVSDSPRYVIYSHGQSLKPAPNSIYTGSGPYFGMVTNYQVTAETATRAVVRFNGGRVDNLVPVWDPVAGSTNWVIVPSITNNSAVVEEFNPLPSN